MKPILNLYREWSGVEPARCETLAGAGSNRRYYRLTDSDGQTLVGVEGISLEENAAFVGIARHLLAKGLPVPRVVAVSADGMCYLQEDLGNTSLYDALKGGREAGGEYDDGHVALLTATIRMLPSIQFLGSEGMDWSICYPQPEFDEMNAMFDLNYFKYCFLKPSGVDFQEVVLERDFQLLTRELTRDREGYGFMYRDFQARNVMLHSRDGEDAKPYFIDFQGARRGPCYYDVASFLWQASARYSSTLRRQLVGEYYEALCLLATTPSTRRPSSTAFLSAREDFDRRLQTFVLFRMLQVLGAYGYRGYFERKRHFLESIPPAIDNMVELLAEGACDAYPYLKQVLRQLAAAHADSRPPSSSSPILCGDQGGASSPALIVRIYSFSYRKGIPSDESGNGGGYVFDCRGVHNPGRYDEYKQLTGMDVPVIRFLEDDGEITRFLESVYRLADAHVKRYIERGFTSLMFSFGCTGGQHRSVYSAQHLAEHLHSKFGIEVHVCHREQGIFQKLTSGGQAK